MGNQMPSPIDATAASLSRVTKPDTRIAAIAGGSGCGRIARKSVRMARMLRCRLECVYEHTN
jgi:hypothetical protein